MPAPEVPLADADGAADEAVPDALREADEALWLAEAEAAEVELADEADETLDETDEAADEAEGAADEAAEEAAEEAEPDPDEMRLVDDGADCDSVAEPDEARPDEPLTPRHESEPAWMVTGAVAAVAPVESVRVRVIDVPAAMLTVQVNWVSVVGCAPRTASGVPESWPPGRTRT